MSLQHGSDSTHEIGPLMLGRTSQLVERQIQRFREFFRAHMKRAICAWAYRNPGIEANRRRHHEPVVVVGVFTDQIDASGRTEDPRRHPKVLLKVIGEGGCRRIVGLRSA